ncbi:MAG TPA: amidohydrolase family protein [Rubrobacter sp.]|nr:amidohydrolase family protein [Rubrobacter sp.]
MRQRLRRGERRSFRFGGELVQDGKIAEVAEEASHPPNAEVVDLSDRTVMPGFIDTHVHLTWTPPTLPSRRSTPRLPRR